MQSSYSIAFCGTSLSWYWYYQPPLIKKLRAATGRFIRPFGYGVNGSDSSGGVARIAQTAADHPDFAFLEYSMNDAANLSRGDAYTNTVSMITTLKTVLPASRIFLMTMNPSTESTRLDIGDYYDDYRSISASEGVGLVDNEPLWEARGAVSDYTPDGIHPYEADTVAVTTTNLYATLLPLIT
jgi:lysophospholipase L1-like esterase